MYKECLSKMSSYELRNQIEQLLNYSPNFFSDNKYCIGFMLSVFSNLFKQYTKHTFCSSIDNSVQCILYPNNYTDCVKSLTPNDKNSFIIAPLLSQNHLFTCVILKNDTNYECTLVNKGGTDGNHAYLKYIIPEKNINSLVLYLRLDSKNALTTGKLYDVFANHSIFFKELTDIHSSSQKINNCYYKEFEAGLKYAYSNCYINNFNVPKWPVSTLCMHQQYISFVMTLDISSQTTRHLKNLYDVYTANKTFRDHLNAKKKRNFRLKNIPFIRFFNKDKSSDFKLINFNYFKSSFGYNENNQSTFEALSKCLSLVDLKTLKQNLDFFVNICEHHKLEEHLDALDKLQEYMFNSKSSPYANDPDVEAFFPNVIHELALKYSNKFDKLSDALYESKDWVRYLKCLDVSLNLYPHNTLALSRIGDFYFKANDMNKALEYFSKALNLVPQSEVLLGKRATAYTFAKNFKKALQDCSRLEEINPNNSLIKPLKDACNEHNKDDLSPAME